MSSGSHKRSSTIKHYISGLEVKNTVPLIKFRWHMDRKGCKEQAEGPENYAHIFEFLEIACSNETHHWADPRPNVCRALLQHRAVDLQLGLNPMKRWDQSQESTIWTFPKILETFLPSGKNGGWGNGRHMLWKQPAIRWARPSSSSTAPPLPPHCLMASWPK